MAHRLEKLLAWEKQLHSCTGLHETALCLCRALAELSQACTTDLFLFDYTGTHLQHVAQVQQGVLTEPTARITYEQHPDDPLCYAIRSGTICTVPLSSDPLFVSLKTIALPDSCPVKICMALPLGLPRQKTFGGVMLGFKKSLETLPEEVFLICNHAAALLALMETKKQKQLLAEGLREEREQREESTHQPDTASLGIVGNSSVIQNVFSLARKAAATSVTVLVTGETGTGKELIASAIHRLSPRRQKPFLTINCAAIPEALLESELFGYEKGAFTGASTSSPGLLRSAAGGTLLLDEIGDMPLPLQAKLLRFLQEKAVRPVGGTTSYSVDLRIIAATNSDLDKAVDEGTFRRDLYHRLAVFPIALTPLCKRREDILPLVEHYLQLYAVKYYKPKPKLSHEDIQRLLVHDYPGNVRELAAMLEQAMILWKQTTPFQLHNTLPDVQRKTLPAVVQDYEKALISATFSQCNGNTLATAAALGIPRRTLAHKLQVYGLPTAATANRA